MRLASPLLTFLLALPYRAFGVGDSVTSDYSTAPEHSTPQTPQQVLISGGRGNVPSRVVYPDEDPGAARLSWFRGKTEQTQSGGVWKYVEERLKHPSWSFGVRKTSKTKGKKPDAEPSDTFMAGENMPSERSGQTTEAEVHVDTVSDDITRGGTTRRDTELLMLPQDRLAERNRRRQRFNEGGFQRTAGAIRGHARDAWPPTSDPHDGFGGAQPNWRGGGAGEMRSTSPTRWALDTAASKLSSLGSHPQSPREPPPSLQVSTTSTSNSAQDSLDGHDRSRYLGTPPSTDTVSGEFQPGSHPGNRPFGDLYPNFDMYYSNTKDVAPYRIWSVNKGLTSINLGSELQEAGHSQQNYAHWKKTLGSLLQHEWESQLSNRIKWAAENRVDHVRSARVVTSLGAVIGGDVKTANPTFINDPANPAPQLDSLLLTHKHERINAWSELARLVPPALAGHSTDVFDAHRKAEYEGIEPEIQRAVHPIQYLGQMIRDKNAAVVLENTIHDALHQDLRHTPAQVITQLESLQAKQRKSDPTSTKPSTLHNLLGTDYTLHNRFWYKFYRSKPAIKIKNPLHTPLEEFPAFQPFADAVALRKP